MFEITQNAELLRETLLWLVTSSLKPTVACYYWLQILWAFSGPGPAEVPCHKRRIGVPRVRVNRAAPFKRDNTLFFTLWWLWFLCRCFPIGCRIRRLERLVSSIASSSSLQLLLLFVVFLKWRHCSAELGSDETEQGKWRSWKWLRFCTALYMLCTWHCRNWPNMIGLNKTLFCNWIFCNISWIDI